jgi:cytochrome c553
MCEIVKDLSSDDINKVYDCFSGQKFVGAALTLAELEKRGKAPHDKHCGMCHSEGSTQADISGILPGQKMPYIEEQSKFISEGTRHMPEIMMTNFHQLDKSKYGALINYYGSFN